MVEGAASTRDTIAAKACEALGELGLAGLTVAAVAERAAVSTGLVHYHFDTKARLVAAAAVPAVALHHDRRLGALRGKRGLAAVDALWESVEAAASDGAARAWLELALLARAEPAIAATLAAGTARFRDDVAKTLPRLLKELGALAAPAAEDVAAMVEAVLDGALVGLLSGQPVVSVRSAYDAFWLTLLAAGPSRRR